MSLRCVHSRLCPFLQLTLRHQVRRKLIHANHNPARCYAAVNEPREQPKDIQTPGNLDSIPHSQELEPKSSTSPFVDSREQFNLAIEEFKTREKYSKGHVELIKVAMTQMEKLNLEKDIDVYNKVISIFPKGRFAPRRMLDAIWPRSIPQLELSLEILTKMEENGIRPNQETYDLLNEIFGKMSLPVQKCIRIAYLFDKYEFSDPYKYYYGELPSDPMELSKLILQRITAGKGQVTVHKDSPEEQTTYILSACLEDQVSLLQSDVSDGLLHVEGPHRLWQHRLELYYYTLRLTGSHAMDALLPEDQMETAKKEGAVLSVCMCHPGSQDTLEEWMDQMLTQYPNLTEARVVYDIKEDSDSEIKKLSSTRTDLLEDCAQ